MRRARVVLRSNAEITVEPGSLEIEIFSIDPDTPKMYKIIRMVMELLMYYFHDSCAIFILKPDEAYEAICGRDDREISRLSSRDSQLWVIPDKSGIWISAAPHRLDYIIQTYDKIFYSNAAQAQ